MLTTVIEPLYHTFFKKSSADHDVKVLTVVSGV
nr:MAG TPA: hypothetical protein [Caudoviricetes sp.]